MLCGGGWEEGRGAVCRGAWHKPPLSPPSLDALLAHPPSPARCSLTSPGADGAAGGPCRLPGTRQGPLKLGPGGPAGEHLRGAGGRGRREIGSRGAPSPPRGSPLRSGRAAEARRPPRPRPPPPRASVLASGKWADRGARGPSPGRGPGEGALWSHSNSYAVAGGKLRKHNQTERDKSPKISGAWTPPPKPLPRDRAQQVSSSSRVSSKGGRLSAAQRPPRSSNPGPGALGRPPPKGFSSVRTPAIASPAPAWPGGQCRTAEGPGSRFRRPLGLRVRVSCAQAQSVDLRLCAFGDPRASGSPSPLSVRPPPPPTPGD